MSKLKYNEETYDISQFPNPFTEYGKSLERKESKKRFVINLFKENMPLEFIIRVTELSKEEVLNLKRSWEKGKKDNQEENSIRIAQNLLAENLSIDLIVRTTGLSKDKVLELKESL